MTQYTCSICKNLTNAWELSATIYKLFECLLMNIKYYSPAQAVLLLAAQPIVPPEHVLKYSNLYIVVLLVTL